MTSKAQLRKKSGKNPMIGTVSNGFRHRLSPTDRPPQKNSNSRNPKTQAIYYSMSSRKPRAFEYFLTILSNESTRFSKAQEC